MFSSKDLKVKLVYMGFGGMIAIIGMLFAFGLLSSVTAQNDKFDTIQCSKLAVVDAGGKNKVVLSNGKHGGVVAVFGKDGSLGMMLRMDEYGGRATLFDKDGKSGVMLRMDEDGGVVTAYGKDALSGAEIRAISAVKVWDTFGMAYLSSDGEVRRYKNE